MRYDDASANLKKFLSRLLQKDARLEMLCAGRTFRRRTAEFWEVWPMPVPDGEFHRVLFVDGIWLAERLVVLICCSEDRVVSWYMAQSENSRAWSALMEPIPAPDVVVTDGGSGFAKAVRAAWPRTKVQRCLFHAYAQVKRCTSTRPKLQAGRELYQTALDLTHAPVSSLKAPSKGNPEKSGSMSTSKKAFVNRMRLPISPMVYLSGFISKTSLNAESSAQNAERSRTACTTK